MNMRECMFIAAKMNKPVELLGLPTNIKNLFKRYDIKTIGDIYNYHSENLCTGGIRSIRNMGVKSCGELNMILKRNGLVSLDDADMDAERTVSLTEEEFGLLSICAIRYCHGRKTYMPSLIQGIVVSHIQDYQDKDIRILKEDCEFQKSINAYGDEQIDKPGWMKYKQVVEKELEGRDEI